jgi:MSHA biogenesis protein MshG
MIAFGALCLAFLILVVYVVPRFSAVYGQFHAALPLPTRIMIDISVILKGYWHIFILLAIVAAFGFTFFVNSRRGRPMWDNLKLHVPVFGSLVSMLIMARFARITSILMKSGVPILEILELVSKTCGNVVIERAILDIRESVSLGKGISGPMRSSRLFPPAVVQMTAIGEQTGRVDELLLSVADYYEREAGYTIKTLSTYLEPILVFILAIMVLMMALAIFLPMWNLIRIFKAG